VTRRSSVVALVATVAAIYGLRLDRAAGLIVDDAWYILLAKALAQGDGFKLISSATAQILPAVPPGFPLVLAPVFFISPQFPDNVLLLKAISVAAMFGVGVVFYRFLARDRGIQAPQAAGVAVLTVLTPGFVFLATSTVMSECVFTLAQLLTIVLLERSTRGDAQAQWRGAAGAGVMAAATLLTRTAGVAVLLAGVLYLLKDLAWRRAVAFAAAALVCLMPWLAYSAIRAPTAAERADHGGPIAFAYSDLLAMRRPGDPVAGRTSAGDLPARVGRNLVNVFGRDLGGVFVPVFFRGPDESGQEVVSLGGSSGLLAASMGSAGGTMVIAFGLSAIVLVGFAAAVRRRVTSAEMLVVLSLGMILLTSGRTFRYVLPLAPFLWLYFFDGLRIVALGRAAVVRMALVLLVVLQLQDHVQYILLKVRATPPPEWLADAREVDDLFSWMNHNLHEPGGVATTNPGLVFLRTGRKTLVSEYPALNRIRWKASGVRYIVSLRTVRAPSTALGFKKLYDSPRRNLFVFELSDP
jgi:hypothetical protein